MGDTRCELFRMNSCLKTSQSDEKVSASGQKYSANQRRVAVPQITFDLQKKMQNRIFKSTSIVISSLSFIKAL